MTPPSFESKLKRVVGGKSTRANWELSSAKNLKASRKILLRKRTLKCSLPQKCTSDSHMDARGFVYVHIYTVAFAQHTPIPMCSHAQNKFTAACFSWRPNTEFESLFYFSSKKFAKGCRVLCEAVSLFEPCSVPLSLWELAWDVIC